MDISRADLAERVRRARAEKGWSREEAGRNAGISSITWKRIEDGLNVHEAKLAAALKSLGLRSNGDALPEVQRIGSTQKDAEDLVSFEISGNFGVSAVVKGPVKDVDALQAAASRLIAGMQLDESNMREAP